MLRRASPTALCAVAIGLALCWLGASACSGDSAPPAAAVDAGWDGSQDRDTTFDPAGACPQASEPTAVGICSSIATLKVRNQRALAQCGAMVRVTAEDGEGRPIEGDVSSCFRVVDAASCVELASSGTPAGASSGLVALLLMPDADSVSRDVAASIVDGLDPQTRAAIFRWSSRGVTQLATYGTDRTRSKQLMDRGLGSDDGAPVPIEEALDSLAADILDVSTRRLDGPRLLVIVAPGGEVDPVATSVLPEHALDIRWVVGEGEQGRAQGREVAAEIAALEAGPAVEIGVCAGSPEVSSIIVQVRGSRVAAGLRLDETPRELASDGPCAPCSPPSLVPVDDTVTAAVEFHFSPAQRAVYQGLVDAYDKSDFELDVTPAPGQGRASARARLRGQSSLGCERKSYALNLRGPQPRHLLPRSATDEFFLIAMCLDDRYINQVTADTVLAGLGLFPLSFGLTELVVDGQSQGVYLLMEKPSEAILREQSRVRAIIRRDTDIDGKPPEIKRAFDDPDRARIRYQALLESATTAHGVELEDLLRQQMDLDQYLTWIASMTLLGNGDYIDEVWAISTETTDASGAAADTYSSMAWDPDDLFSACHHDGRFAIDDPHGLLYCTESVLDHAIFADPHIYALYVDVLDDLIRTKLTPEVFAAALDATVSHLLALLVRDAPRLAMVELLASNPGAADYAEAERDIRAARDTMVSEFHDSTSVLLGRIAAYRAAQ